MTDNIAYINLDYFPPTAEVLCSVPGKAVEQGIGVLYLRMIDNFPWDFDCRLRSFSSFDESTIDFLAKESETLNLELRLVFPAEDDFPRILRLEGYRRLIDKKESVLVIDPDSVGFKPLIESVAEDLSSLYPRMRSFVLKGQHEKKNYTIRTARILTEAEYRISEIDENIDFISAEEFIFGPESDVLESYKSMTNVFGEASAAMAEMRQLLIMSLLAGNPPAAGKTGINRLLKRFLSLRQEFISASEHFLRTSKGRVDACWMDSCVKSCDLALNEEHSGIIHRLKQSGLLN